MQLKLSKFEKIIASYFYELELKRLKKEKSLKQENILPNYILKRRIKIITNGELVFDSEDYKDTGIPLPIQYSIKQYGYPDVVKPNNKTPIIYNITTNASSIFSNQIEQEMCLNYLKERNENNNAT